MIWEMNDTHCICLMAAIMKHNEPLVGMKEHAENACFLFFHISEFLKERIKGQERKPGGPISMNPPKSLGEEKED